MHASRMQAGIETLQDNLLVVCFIERTLLMASMARCWHVLAHTMWHHPIRSLLDAGMQLAELELWSRSWNGKSVVSVQAARDLDTVIAAHSQYLETLLKKALLDDNVADRPGAAAQNGLQGHLHVILRHMLNLMGPVARLNEAVRAPLAFITAWTI
jgi:hypothetical protein